MKHFRSVFFDPNTYGGLQSANHFYHEIPWYANSRTWDSSESPEMQVKLERRRRAFMQSGASWCRMLVSQPAPPALGYGWKERRDVRFRLLVWRGYIVKSARRLELASSSLPRAKPSPISLSQSGLHFGQLYDLVQYHAGHHEYATLLFRVFWGELRLTIQKDELIRVCEELFKETSVVFQF